MSEAVREENALMSRRLFVPQKPAAVSAAFGCFSLFASDIGFPLSVGRPEVRPTDLRMAVFPTVAFPADLLRGKKALNC